MALSLIIINATWDGKRALFGHGQKCSIARIQKRRRGRMLSKDKSTGLTTFNVLTALKQREDMHTLMTAHMKKYPL